MKRFTFLLPATVSVAAAVANVDAARPHYGGTLRVQTQAIIRNLDPSPSSPAGMIRARVQSLVFETLTRADPAGGLRPALATTWEHDARDLVWRLHLRAGVTLHGGSALEPWHVASALRAANPRWKVSTDGDLLIVEIDRPNRDLAWELADVRNAVVVRTPAGTPSGTGPFRLERIDSTRIALHAHDEYWGGRPFLDAVQIDMGAATDNRLSNLEVGRSEMATIGPTEVRRLAQRNLRIVASRPLATYAVVFEPPAAAAAAEPLRRTIAATIDREAIRSVLLQRYGEPATMLLPGWLSGYAALAAAGDRPMSRAAISALPLEQRALTLRVDADDTLAHALADRIAVDVREIGLTMKVQAPVGLAPRADARLLRIDFAATTPDRALAAAVETLGQRVVALATNEAALPPGAPVDAVYRLERALLERCVIVPVVHVPEMYAITDRVRSSDGDPALANGAWNIANVWLRPERR